MLKAIETRYKGYRMRSRLEARWAVFFDECGVTWTYEEQGYDLGDAGRYLPDFVIYPNHRPYHKQVWVEIKPETPTLNEAKKMYELIRQSEGVHPGLIVVGTPGEELIWYYQLHPATGDVEVVPADVLKSTPFWCDLFGFLRNTKSYGVSPRTSAAYRAARAARFEHGENGNVR